MFPNEKSSSDVLTSKTNAFVQKFKEVQPINPTDQVPDLRDTIDCRSDYAMKTAFSTLSPPTLHTGCEPCALCRVSGEGDRAGPLLSLPLVPPMSVISSSIVEESLPPSATNMGGAPKSSKTCGHQQNCSFFSSNSAQTHSRASQVNVSCKWSPSRSQTPEHIPVAAMYKVRWGIAAEMRLRGGGETATAPTGWNNNNTNNTTATYGQPSNSSVPTSQATAQWNNNNSQPPQQPPTTGNSGVKPNNNTTPGSQTPATSQAQAPQATQPALNNTQPQTNGQAAGQPTTAQNGNSSGSGGSTWAQAAGKGLPAATQATTTPAPTSASTKQQLEQLNNMREALFSQDGWGAHVNQDNGWDIPSSPEPGQKDSNGAALPPVWKPNVNNGTDLWEANLRNGGQPPPRVEKTTPWGSHTPASNIGGTWGVDDDVGDNVWNPQGQWPSGPNQPQPPLWAATGGSKKEPDWPGATAANWGDLRGATGGAMDPRDMARGNAMVDQRDSMRNVLDPHRGMVGGDMMMRGDPRGISGRLNGGASEGMWPQQPPHHLPPAKPGAWPGGPPPKDKSNGWEEPSPPQQRRNIPNYDDGTSLWGTQQQRMGAAAMQAAASQNKVSHWKDVPSGGMGRGMPPGMPQNRMAPNDMKTNNPLWTHPARNGSWDGQHDLQGAAGPWPEDKVGVTSWNDPTLLGPKYKMAWDGDVPNTWDPHTPKQPQKPLTKDLVWASKQFRILVEMGFKKEEVETALKTTNMVFEDALEMLNMTGGANWRGRHSDLEPPFDHSGFPSQRFNPQQLPFAPPGSSGNGPNSGNQTMSPAIVQKLMTQQPPPQQAPSQPPAPYTQTSRAQQPNQPSAHQLRMLVQQIQMAVQAGYLNHQILNQPLAPQTLILLNQLLQHIKVLQGLYQQQHVFQLPNSLGKPNNNQALLHNAVQITKTKQQITNLQNQIQAQQAIYVKQQQHQMTPQQGDFFKNQQVHDPLSALPSNFSDLAMNKEPQHSSAFQSQQSRLTQWKLPSVDKDTDLVGSEFSRAPGTTTKPSGGNSSPNLNPVLGQNDGTWSRSNSEGGWPETSSVADDGKEWPNTSQANSQAFTDLVPEFEPGKPWKGTQMKSIEDDPSITPGSVVRSPLSLAASIKDTDIFSSGGKTSPTSAGADMPVPPLSLSSNTWSFNPPASTASSFTTSPLGKLGSKNTWAEAPLPGGNELWGAPNKARGPPPGLSSKTPTTNGWGQQGGGRWGPQATPSWNQPTPTTWLLLKNLTPQIDGSTLKTLCLQHGPLTNFHLYLNQGICLAKYNSREEANKAQGALNNCVLSNTTIFCEMLGENDVQSVLAHLNQQSGSGGGWGRGGGKGDTWGTGWPPSNSGTSSLWSPDPPQDPHRSTPSSLFLPGDLLGPGDSM